MSPLDKARLSALHSGAFISNAEHAKYDMEKFAICHICHLEDDREHWLICPRYQHIRQSIPGWFPDNVEQPRCVLNHLLVPKLEPLVRWRQMLYELPDETQNFYFEPPKQGLQHLFIDGSCAVETFKELQLAAWAVVCATEGQIVSKGFLPGITQSIDRAELTALLSAVRWGAHSEVSLYIWSDSQSTVLIAHYLLRYHMVPDAVENFDLWSQVLEALDDRDGADTIVKWIPSHLDSSLTEDSFEDWVADWNDMADKLATHTNYQRDQCVRLQLTGLRGIMETQATRLRQLRQFFFTVADQPKDASNHDISSDEEAGWPWIPYEENLPLNWRVKCLHGHFPVPGIFLIAIIQWVCAAERQAGSVRVLSDLEFVFALTIDQEFQFPFQVGGTLGCTMQAPQFLFQRPTVVILLRAVQSAMNSLAQLFPSLFIRTPPASTAKSKVFMSFSGLRLHCPDDVTWREAQNRRFTDKRQVRRTGDLSRPLA
jgi:ribonuclease HI